MSRPRPSTGRLGRAIRDRAFTNQKSCVGPATWRGRALTHKAWPVGRDDHGSIQIVPTLVGLCQRRESRRAARILVAST